MKTYKKTSINNFSAITIVELVVVITILAILGTISFITLWNYVMSARDAVRISDAWNIRKWLEYNFLQGSQYVSPHLWVDVVTSSWAVAWKQWTFWDTTVRQIRELSDAPLDPLTFNEYTYSTIASWGKYELWVMLEWDWWLSHNADLLTQKTYAANWQFSRSYVAWNYNWEVLKANSWSQDYFLALPSILSNSLENVSLEYILDNNLLVIDWYNKSPHSYNDFDINPYEWWDIVSSDDVIVFTWSPQDLRWDISNRLELLQNLQNAYSGTIIENSWDVDDYIDLPINVDYPSDLTVKIANETVLYKLSINLSDEDKEQITDYSTLPLTATGWIDTTNTYAWGSNAWWINFWATESNVTVWPAWITWKAWTQNYWWMNFDTTLAWVTNNCNWILNGHAWVENIWWVNFSWAFIDSEGYFKWSISDSIGGSIVFGWDNFSLQTDWRPWCAE